MGSLNDYSRFDQLLHRLAFSTPSVQMAAADLEDSLFGKDIAGVQSGAPIFITSLPRAGTTILLIALNEAPEAASHLYRDMPFVMAPVLWSRLSGRFRRQAGRRERAHGDGIEIGYDSPEAFEEVIWRSFWPEKFGRDGIAMWSGDDVKPEGRAFLLRHFQKIVALRTDGDGRTGRYLSKNNGNIARIDLIDRMFPDADILVPVREPLAHAASLQRQHTRFLEQHDADPFALRYMRDIGHYEFGALHRPILFEGFDGIDRGLSPADLDYWLTYWIAAFEHVAARRERVHLLGYEELCCGGEQTGHRLCALLDLDHQHAAAIGGHFRPAPALGADLDGYQSPLRDRAEALHAELLRR